MTAGTPDFNTNLLPKQINVHLKNHRGKQGPNAESTIEKYTITPYNECQILLADPLALIDADKEKKTALWTNLQQLFLK